MLAQQATIPHADKLVDCQTCISAVFELPHEFRADAVLPEPNQIVERQAIASPASTWAALILSTSITMSFGAAPNAIRTPISCVRCRTAYRKVPYTSMRDRMVAIAANVHIRNVANRTRAFASASNASTVSTSTTGMSGFIARTSSRIGRSKRAGLRHAHDQALESPRPLALRTGIARRETTEWPIEAAVLYVADDANDGVPRPGGFEPKLLTNRVPIRPEPLHGHAGVSTLFDGTLVMEVDGQPAETLLEAEWRFQPASSGAEPSPPRLFCTEASKGSP